MGTLTTDLQAPSGMTRWRTFASANEKILGLVGIGLIVLLAAGLRFANLGALGYANHYYAAGVTGMLQSWHNFFFVVAEPGASVTIDKPPVGFWIQAASAYVFGVDGFGLLLPEIVAGILSVVVVYHLVRRTFGIPAGLVAALALAITPVVVATDRNNTIDSLLILTLLLAAWAFIKATETARFRFLLLGAVLVGVGFNIKMLEAFLPVPAFLALYLFGAPERIWKKLGKLAVAVVLLLAVSMSWATIVDLTPAAQRPYIGSSGNNTELSLIFGYNGVERLMGMGGRGGLLSSLLGGNQANQRGRGVNGGGFQPPQGQAPNGGGFGGGGFAGGFGGGLFGVGFPGPQRLFLAPLSTQMSWLLPFGLLSAVLLLASSRLRFPLSQKHQALMLWGGWLLTGGVFFSVAGFFHPYYLSMLAPPLAALVGIGAKQVWELHQKHRWLAIGLVLAVAAVTLWFQYGTAATTIRLVWWLPFMVGLFLIGATLLIASARTPLRGGAAVGLACVIAALMVTPGIWSGLTMLDSSANQSLPAAYDGRSSGPGNLSGAWVNAGLLNYLQANTQGMRYMVAVPSSMQGSDYVLATGRGVLYLGGFMGADQVETVASLQQLIAQGELRYIYLDGRGGGGFGGGFGRGGQPAISQWVTANCSLVQGYDTQTQNQGAPDGTGGTNSAGGGFGGFGGFQVSLYDCANAVTPNAAN